MVRLQCYKYMSIAGNIKINNSIIKIMVGDKFLTITLSDNKTLHLNNYISNRLFNVDKEDI